MGADWAGAAKLLERYAGIWQRYWRLVGILATSVLLATPRTALGFSALPVTMESLDEVVEFHGEGPTIALMHIRPIYYVKRIGTAEAVLARMLAIITVLMLCATCFAANSPSQDSDKVLIGFTLSHTVAECDTVSHLSGVHPTTGTRAEYNILLNYDNNHIREQTRSILRQMRDRGADFVRSIMWFHPIENIRKPLQADMLGLIDVTEGVVPQDKIQNLTRYIEDVKQAGYGRLYLVIGPQRQANPVCRHEKFGDCFDRDTLTASWAVIKQVRTSISKLYSDSFSIILDIAPEYCPLSGTNQPAVANTKEYTGYMVKKYNEEFGDQNYIVSCGGGRTAKEALDRLQNVGKVYTGLNVKPTVLDIHVYHEDPKDVERVLLGAEAEAESLDTNFLILETYYDNLSLFAGIEDLRKRQRLPRLGAVAVWPLDSGKGCHFSRAAPFDLDRLQAAVR